MLDFWEIIGILAGGIAALILAWCLGAAIDRCKNQRGNPNLGRRRYPLFGSRDEGTSDNPLYSSRSHSNQAFINSAHRTFANRIEEGRAHQQRLFDHFSRVFENQTPDFNSNHGNAMPNRYGNTSPNHQDNTARGNYGNNMAIEYRRSFRSASPSRPSPSRPSPSRPSPSRLSPSRPHRADSNSPGLSLVTLPRSYADVRPSRNVDSESTPFINTSRINETSFSIHRSETERNTGGGARTPPDNTETQIVVYLPPFSPSSEEPPPSYEEVMREARPPSYYEVD